MKTSTRVILPLLAIAAGALAGIWLARDGDEPQPPLEHATLYPMARPLPDFALRDQQGSPFGPARLAGRWSILFFGYTHCPDVCPATLAALAAARRELADLPPAQQPQVVLVSVDPARDTAGQLAGYTSFFDPAFIGVTGEAQELARLTGGIGVAVIPGAPDEHGQYTVDHTAALFLVNPAGAVAAVFSAPHSPDGIAHDYRTVMARIGGGAA